MFISCTNCICICWSSCVRNEQLHKLQTYDGRMIWSIWLVLLILDCLTSCTDDTGDGASNFCVIFPSHIRCSVVSNWFTPLGGSITVPLFIFMFWMTLFASQCSVWPIWLGTSMCCVKCIAKSLRLCCTSLHIGQINVRFNTLIKLVRKWSTLEKHVWQHNGHESMAIITIQTFTWNTILSSSK